MKYFAQQFIQVFGKLRYFYAFLIEYAITIYAKIRIRDKFICGRNGERQIATWALLTFSKFIG